MNRRILRILSVLLTVFMLCTAMIGCVKTETDDGTIGTSSGTEPKEDPYAGPFPLETDVTLTYWFMMNPNLSAHYTNLGETEYAKELQRITGINVEYVHPADYDQFALIIAANEMPDIMEYRWERQYPGGVTKAIADGVVYPLNDFMEKGYTPNYSKYLEENPNFASMVKTLDGQIAGFPFIPDQSYVLIGPALRGDWLKELNLSVPETIDDWYVVLKAFKDKGVQAPYTYVSTVPFIIGAYDTNHSNFNNGYYIRDKKVVYGPAEDNYKKMLETWNKWYQEGLVDVDYATVSREMVESKMATGQAGSTSAMPSNFSMLVEAGKASDPNYELVAAKFPVLNKGDTPRYDNDAFGSPYNVRSMLGMITSNCKHPEIAARLLDFAYSEEGVLLNEWGIEGVSYEKKSDGSLMYTDNIYNNPDGWTFFQSKAKYSRGYADGAFMADPRRFAADNNDPAMVNAVKTWSISKSAQYTMPFLRESAEDSEKLAGITPELKTYQEQAYLTFVLEKDSLKDWDQYLKTLDDIGLQTTLDIYQKLLDVHFSK